MGAGNCSLPGCLAIEAMLSMLPTSDLSVRDYLLGNRLDEILGVWQSIENG